ncbi:hypothetical protein QTP70_003696, partial [Hemibagrus guttatus]
WKGDKVPDIVGTAKLTQAITLLPRQEHLVWGKLPLNVPASMGSAILIEPARAQTHKKSIMLTFSPVVAVEDLGMHSDHENKELVSVQSQCTVGSTISDEDSCIGYRLRESLQKLNLGFHTARFLQLNPKKLRSVLSDMEEQEIIRKSYSEWASPLVLVWKKTGDLRVCVDYRWLNTRTVKDAHPLPHQADCLAALGGNAIFSAIDLTSGFYNIVVSEEDRKFTAFTTPMGLYEFNRLPQGLCNSPASFMRLMTNIFGDQNFLTLLCYLDDLLVYAPNEEGNY